MQQVHLGEVRRRQVDVRDVRRLLGAAYHSFRTRGLNTDGLVFHDQNACVAALHLCQLESEHGPNTESSYSSLRQLAKEPRATEVTRLDAAAWLGDMYQRKQDHTTARRCRCYDLAKRGGTKPQ
ncbi:hypothetical protein PENNAL_c0007G02609 [Penicillium nalgiovense]|uniref:Uncharacterized protein n=1 Tax=Penicillium nalgiovense TaxID=60175 RepID=A0A1V6YZF6_PENNA|nr:hypothetical protein PENNAL_c0007G02609 [Penicillium nalgiovense]